MYFILFARSCGKNGPSHGKDRDGLKRPRSNRMISKPPLFLLIDGNNLAHFLYTNLSPGQKMTPGDSQRLITHLAAYARTYRDVDVELCLDRFPGAWDPQPENLHIYYAEYPRTGDDLLLGRLWFHHLGGRNCMMITNDEVLLDEVAETGAAALRVYDFVRRPGLNAPVFRAPEELPALPGPFTRMTIEPPQPESLQRSIYFRIITEDGQTGPNTPPGQPVSRAQQQPDILKEHFPAPQPWGETALLVEEDLEASLALLDGPVEIANTPTMDGVDDPYYILNLDQWPVEEGVRFLLNSFCPAHREKYQDLMSHFSIEALRPADLRALAELLLHTCGDEPDFARHGSLMTRVRLALLQARGEPLSIKDLAARTGFKLPGLRGRIRQKARPWVIIA